MSRLMPKILVILVAFVALGMIVLQQRQRSLELRYQAAQIHRDIQKAQSQLWRQQLEMAEYTSPKVMQALETSSTAHRIETVDVDSARE